MAAAGLSAQAVRSGAFNPPIGLNWLHQRAQWRQDGIRYTYSIFYRHVGMSLGYRECERKPGLGPGRFRIVRSRSVSRSVVLESSPGFGQLEPRLPRHGQPRPSSASAAGKRAHVRPAERYRASAPGRARERIRYERFDTNVLISAATSAPVDGATGRRGIVGHGLALPSRSDGRRGAIAGGWVTSVKKLLRTAIGGINSRR